MSKATIGKRTRNLFDPSSDRPFKLSRSKLERFIQCPRCFYLDRRQGVDRPDMPPWSLNSAVDHLFKKEFDLYRARGEPHPLMQEYGVVAVPFQHPDLDEWRENFKGLRHHHEPTNMIISGAIDDIWVAPDGRLIVVDYKATSTQHEITFIGDNRRDYKRQIEIYQWLLRRMGHPVSDTGYFVYANGRKDRPAFEGRLDFDVRVIPYEGNSNWVEQCVIDAHQCLILDTPPESAPTCSYCLYRQAAEQADLDSSRPL